MTNLGLHKLKASPLESEGPVLHRFKGSEIVILRIRDSIAPFGGARCQMLNRAGCRLALRLVYADRTKLLKVNVHEVTALLAESG
jgi:hypothetical protein